MSWLFSQALVEEYSAANSTDAEPSAQLNVTLTPHKFWRNDKTMEFSKLSQFGLTLRLLTADRGEELLTSYLAAFPARTSVQPAQEPASMESEADSGPTWFGLFARYSPTESKWKTAQCSLLGDSEEFSETWPRWGSMRNGVSYLRQIPELPICESASGLWVTPSASDSSRGGKITDAMSGRSLVQQLNTPEYWPIPTASLGTKGGRITPRKGREGGTLIEAVSARKWPPPKANDAEKRGNFDINNPRNGLPAAARKWPTPCASASKGLSQASLTRKSGKSRENDRIDHAVMASDGGQLNPEWVEWLMGWPIGWTELKPLATAKFHEWKQQHGKF